jgi:hypothetical protein
VHEAAIRLPKAEGAIVVLGGPAGGKSTIAHRACTELGAALVADDLVLLGAPDTDGSIPVIGWPTRVGVPVGLLSGDVMSQAGVTGAIHRDAVNGWTRERVLLPPPAHRDLFGVAHVGPTVLEGVLVIDRNVDADRSVERLGSDQLVAAVHTAAQVPGQRSLLADPLGLMGGPPINIGSGDAPPPVGSVPAACLRIPRSADLGSLTLWDDLAGFFARPGGAP